MTPSQSEVREFELWRSRMCLIEQGMAGVVDAYSLLLELLHIVRSIP